MTKKISDKDIQDWLKFINDNEKIENKDTYLGINYKLSEKTLDLHGYTIRDANIAVSNLIKNSYDQAVRRLKIITGKGLRSNNLSDPYKSKDLSLLKYAVPYYIQNDKKLMEMIDKIDIDSIRNLNSGEFKIYLKIKK